ncbi:hypothetical protein AAZX31_07G172600 [Glycine max]|uniref:Uncharacterized protein n=3 Tax=Glycine subgen. Soja TaxID=1462606 RepID=I1KLB0_SOYBN|nr:uncharacterized protein LOC100804052 isoform X1 [Glycine max]XP_028240929.1 uncharacterized protein LOC114419459 isoform X1 [Glycine soja]KAG5023250.1 hypothetical protein JHK85_019592 [Glycine max]KAG5143457.1 hypothetical protein JHK82_019152 [Glycine max]KRH49910.1 hypothetical protein GLYMA_07G187300v4 [Glycine max]RZC03575.1 hypothetical protein D0Y65_018302 [Glycine soja]|eukprot:XP_003529282.1 uncharacterized protein LOC100804052 isoform X1 [Glycine max]
MSKKKVSGNTMTLKDFHGGSIPSDLPLPSAPGVTVRTSDRSGFDRPSAWGMPMGRSDHWSRPHTSPATRHYDDKTPFLSNTAPIGRNFDEDERKPLDGGSVPRRTISDESIRGGPPPRVEVRPPEYGLGGSSLGRQVAPVSQTPVGAGNSYSARLTEAVHVGMNPLSLGGSKEQGTAGDGGGYPNVWSMRKEVASAVEPEQPAWSSASAASKLAHASALEKVSSGRWQSKAVHYQTDAEVVRSPELENRPRVNGVGAYSRMDAVGEKEYYDAMLARHTERGLGIDNQMQGGRNELLNYERSRVSRYSDVRPTSAPHHSGGVQLARNDGKIVGSDLQHRMPSEPTERHKLKLLPRAKPVESSEPAVMDYAQGNRHVNDSGHVETVYQAHGHANFVKPVSAGTDSGKDSGQRPKLNLKPRSQPIEQLDGNSERDRNVLFGGARPRELVLKERGIDDVAINNYDVVEHSNRVENNISRVEKLPDHSTQTRYGEKTEDAHLDQKTGRKPERKEQRVDGERAHAQRRNWRGDTRRNGKESNRQPPALERQPSPETWRKPAEQQPKSAPGAAGTRYGRAASAVELAQAFSKSVSDPKVNDKFSGQRGLNTGNSRTQVPFSRLVGPTSRPQINGY